MEKCLMIMLAIIMRIVLTACGSIMDMPQEGAAAFAPTLNDVAGEEFSQAGANVGRKAESGKNVRSKLSGVRKGSEALASENESDGICGQYFAVYCEIDGEVYGCEGEYVIINEDGTGKVMFMDRELDMTWELDGDNLTFTDDEDDTFEGTLQDGALFGTYENVDYSFDYIYFKDIGAWAGMSEALPSENEPEGICGQYFAVSCEIDGEAYGCEGEYVIINEDGTGNVMFMNRELDMTWELDGDNLTFTDDEDDTFEGTLQDGALSGIYAGIEYRYVK